MKGKNSHDLFKKVGGALIRRGALNRDYTVFEKVCRSQTRDKVYETEHICRVSMV